MTGELKSSNHFSSGLITVQKQKIWIGQVENAEVRKPKYRNGNTATKVCAGWKIAALRAWLQFLDSAGRSRIVLLSLYRVGDARANRASSMEDAETVSVKKFSTVFGSVTFIYSSFSCFDRLTRT